jgi:hypothetical protein
MNTREVWEETHRRSVGIPLTLPDSPNNPSNRDRKLTKSLKTEGPGMDTHTVWMDTHTVCMDTVCMDTHTRENIYSIYVNNKYIFNPRRSAG